MRGGLGQIMEIASAENAPFSVFAMFERIDHPARGRDGGLLPGAAGTVSLASGKPMRGKGQQAIPPGEYLRLTLPGGGFGDPKQREREKVLRDVRDGLVSPEAAETYCN